jgi:hypothetical protein
MSKLPEWQRTLLDLLSIPLIILKFIGLILGSIGMKGLQYIRDLEDEP